MGVQAGVFEVEKNFMVRLYLLGTCRATLRASHMIPVIQGE